MTGPNSLGLKLPTGRNLELVLLLCAGVVVIGALIIVELAQTETVGWRFVKYAGAFAVLSGVAHLVVRRFAPYADPVILPIVALLNGLGLVLIYRLDLGNSTPGESVGQPERTHDADQQILWTLLGLAAFVAIIVIIRDHRVLSRYAYLLGLGGLIFLAIPAVLPSAYSEINGSKIWIKTGLFNIQPGEFSKILLIIFSAAFLVSKRELFTTAGRHVFGIDLPRLRDLMPLLIAWFVAIGVLFFESDLGTSLLIYGTMLVMIYVATERVSWLIIGVVMIVIGALIAYQLFAHLQLRVDIWLHPFDDPDGNSYQLVQGLFGLATGGLFGTGLGSGRPNIVPFANTDFIITTIGEELGLVGLAAFLCLFLLFIARGLRTAIAVRDSFGKLLATGLSFLIGIQLFVVVGGVTRLIPLTGLTTPFVSYGGSSLLANYILAAILLRISNAAREPDRGRKPTPGGGVLASPAPGAASRQRVSATAVQPKVPGQ